MKKFAPLLLILLAFVYVSFAHAQTPPARTATVTLSPPTKWEDGSTLDCSAGKCTYNVYRGACNATKTKVVTGATNPAAISLPGTVAGQCITATAVSEGSESLQSAEAKYKGAPGAPVVTLVVTIAVEVAQP